MYSHPVHMYTRWIIIVSIDTCRPLLPFEARLDTQKISPNCLSPAPHPHSKTDANWVTSTQHPLYQHSILRKGICRDKILCCITSSLRTRHPSAVHSKATTRRHRHRILLWYRELGFAHEEAAEELWASIPWLPKVYSDPGFTHTLNSDLSSFGYFYREGAKPWHGDFSKHVGTRSAPGPPHTAQWSYAS